MTEIQTKSQKYILFPQQIEDEVVTDPLIFDMKGNYDIILATLVAHEDLNVFKNYEHVNQAQWNLVSKYLQTSKEERKVTSEGLVKQLDKLEGEIQ
jgi:hypothetical protein